MRKTALLILPLVGIALLGLWAARKSAEASATRLAVATLQPIATTQTTLSSQEPSSPSGNESSDSLETLAVVSGIITIVAFLFSVWIWMRSDVKIKELAGALRTVYDVTGSILWEMNTSRAEDIDARLREAERSLGMVSSVRMLTAKYVESQPGFPQTELGALIERRVVWTEAKMWDLETSKSVTEVWIITPDLKPEISETSAAILVNNNLRAGKRYVYFVPDELPNRTETLNQLYSNIGTLASRRLASRVRVVPFPVAAQPELFRQGNTVVYFVGDPATTRGRVFEEIVFTRVPQRGLFWQEYDETKGESVCHVLRERLQIWNDATVRDAP